MAEEDPNRSHPRSRRESEENKRNSILRGSVDNSGFPFSQRGSLTGPAHHEGIEEEGEEEIVVEEEEEPNRFLERLDTQNFQQIAGMGMGMDMGMGMGMDMGMGMGMAPSQLGMPEPYPGIDAAQYGLFGALEHQAGAMYPPQPMLSTGNLQLQEEGFHGPYARDDPHYLGSHVDPNYGPFDFELPEPDPRELMIQNAKAYLLKTSVKCDLSL